MRSLSLFLVLTAAFFTISITRAPSQSTLTNGLVAYYPFNGNANDASGNGNNGTIYGGVTLATDRFGSNNSAYAFNGVDGYIDIGNPVGNSPTNLTETAWVKIISRATTALNGINPEDVIITKRQVDMSSWPTLLIQSGGPKVGVGEVIVDDHNYIDEDLGTTQTPTNVWFLICGIKSNNTYQIYINGTLENTITDSHPISSAYNMYLMHDGAWSTYCHGVLDDVRIYNRALSSNEVMQLYAMGAAAPTITSQPTNVTVNVGDTASFSVMANGTAPLSYQWSFNTTNILNATNATLTLTNVQLNQAGNYSVMVTNITGSTNSVAATLTVVPSCDPPPSGLVAWWAAEGNALDRIGTNNGTLVGNTSYGPGEVGQGFVFDGNGDGVQIGSATNLALQDFTIEAWVKRASASVVSYSSGTTAIIFGYGTGGYLLYMAPNGQLQFDKLGDVYPLSGPFITDTNFHHVALTKSGSTVVFYLDGIAYAAPAYTGTFTFTGGPAIGCLPASGDDGFLGTIDEVSFYNRALASNEVAAIYLAGSAGKCVMSQAVPAIFTFNPNSGNAGVTVSIVGTNFSPMAASNIVFFGAVQAGVVSASTTNLLVTVPAGATFAPITVTVNGLTAYANQPFLPTFAGNGQISGSSLAPAVTLPTGTGPGQVVYADLDGDGRPDLVIADWYAADISIYQNISSNGNLAFAPRLVLPIVNAAYGNTLTVAVADIDGDGKPDIITLDSTSNLLSIFRNISVPGVLTTNSFATRIDVSAGDNSQGMAVQDLNGDGKPDIVTANANDNNISIFQNQSAIGNISFAIAIKFATGNDASDVAIADLDGDGNPDISVLNMNDGTVSVLRNLGIGGNITTNSFAPPVIFPGVPQGRFIKIGDIDGDGKLDMVVADWTTESISVLRNLTSGPGISTNSFAPAVNFATAGWANNVALGDLNGDGKLDIAVVCQLPSLFSIFQNQSAPGNFTANSLSTRVDYSSGYNPNSATFGDLDGDGRPDLVIANIYDNNISIYQNTVPISGPPSITSQPTNVTVNVGGTASFSVTAGGTAPLSYQWSFGTTNIVNATNATLTLTNVQLNQAGNYSVLVTNTAGSTNSIAATLTVFSANATLINVNFGSYGTNKVGFAATGLTTNDYWNGYTANGSTINLKWSDGSTNSPQPISLSVSNAPGGWGLSTGDGMYDSYIYPWTGSSSIFVALTNLPANSYDFYLYGHGAAANQNTAFQIIIGTNTTAVKATQDSTYAYTSSNWVENVQYVVFRGVQVTNGQPVFITCSPGDSSYALLNGMQIQMYNQAPTPPVITSQPTNVTVNVGDNASFSVMASGTAPLSYQWSFGTTNIANATNATLTLTNVQLSQAGNYSVLVTNIAGSTNSITAALAVVPSCDAPPSGLISWWAGEDNAYDQISGNNGTLVGNTTYGPGEVGQGFVFTGNNGDGVMLGNPTNLQLQNFTIESWIKRASASIVSQNAPNGEIFAYGLNGYGFGMWSDGRLYLTKIGVDSILMSTGISDTNWHHVAVTKSGTTVTFYIDGISYNVAPYTSTFSFTTPAMIGTTTTGTSTQTSFLGSIDEVSLYNRALTSNEIAAIYQAGSAGKCFTPAPPVITSQPTNQTVFMGQSVSFSVSVSGTPPLSYQWRFNTTNILNATNATLTLNNVQLTNAGNYSVMVTNIVGSTNSASAALTVNIPSCDPVPSGIVGWWAGEGNALDQIGGNNGILVGNATYGSGEVGQGFVFDGSGSGVLVTSNSASLHLQNFTIENWIKRASTSVVSHGSGGNGTIFGYGPGGYYFMVNAYGQLIFAQLGNYSYASGPSITDTNWHHVALTMTNGTVTFYLDGVASAASSYNVTFTFTGGPGIGYRPDNGDNSFYGSIDELSVYNRALSSNEVATIYLAGIAGKCVMPHAATATATLFGSFVVSNSITDGGFGYTNTPTVHFVGGGGSGATAVAVVSNGVVTAINMISAGSGYTNAPLVVIDPPFIPNPVLGIAPASILAFSNLTVGAGYQLQQFQSWYWTNQPVNFTASNTVYAQAFSSAPGNGEYRLALAPAPAQAFATPQVVNGFVVGATLTAGGSGYVTPPAVNISGDAGSNATAVAGIGGGAVTNITIINAGMGYTNQVAVQIDPPPAVASFPTIWPGASLNSSNLVPYDNYQVQFKSNLAGTWENWDGGLFSPTSTTNSQYIFITNGSGFFRLQYVP